MKTWSQSLHPTQHNTYKHNKRKSISSASLDPVAIKRFRTDALDSADTETGRWVLCYWILIESCYHEDFLSL